MKMTRVQDYVGGGSFSAPSVEDGRRLGIEIEIEGVREYAEGQFGPIANGETQVPFGKYWKIKGDGSLRNFGAEFMTQPILIKELEFAVSEFYDGCKKYPHWKGTSRCGIHGHVDCRDFKMENLGALYTAYSLAEPALFEFVGKDREECIYCVPWYRAPNDADMLVNRVLAPKMEIREFMPAMEGGISGRIPRLSKYSAFYWSPLAWYGTVEFRQAPTWNGAFQTMRWLKACYALVDYCSTKTEEQVFQEWRKSPRGFLTTLVGGNIPVSWEAIEAVDFWEIEERIERMHKVPVEDNWKPRLRETGLAKRKRKKAAHTIKRAYSFGTQVPLAMPQLVALQQAYGANALAGQATTITTAQNLLPSFADLHWEEPL